MRNHGARLARLEQRLLPAPDGDLGPVVICCPDRWPAAGRAAFEAAMAAADWEVAAGVVERLEGQRPSLGDPRRPIAIITAPAPPGDAS